MGKGRELSRLHERLARVVVVGTTGSGKTTFARRLAASLGSNHVELDSLYWKPNWTPAEQNELHLRVESAAAGQRWVIDGNYSQLRPLIWPRATHVVWLDYRFIRVMWQLLWRTIRRTIKGEELFSGNQETLRMAIFSRDSILLWGLKTYHRRKRRYQRFISQGAFPNIEYIVFKNPKQSERWLQSL